MIQTMRQFTLLTALLFFAGTMISCNAKKQKATSGDKTAIPGQWLILYPEHILYTQKAQEAYTRATQDSLTNLFGLKMIGLRDNGEFREGDSILKSPGTWMVKENGAFLIDGGGQGFGKFRGAFDGIRNDTMLIAENMALAGDTVKVIWHLKRLDDKSAGYFFNLPANWWRQRPDSTENEFALAKRVKAMLEYYGLYFSIVSKESSYFLPLRVPLPFKYYQHAMTLRPFTDSLPFNTFFYNNNDARKAHLILGDAMKKLEKHRFPSGKDFVIEYATFIQMIDTAIAR